MPSAEVDIDIRLVRALLAEQHFDLADQTLVIGGEGFDTVMVRVGEDLAARLPRRTIGAELLEHELRWLPTVGAHLPLAVPVPLRVGEPGCGYPWRWSIVPWLPGQTAAVAPPTDAALTAVAMGSFLAALHRPAPAEAPRNPFRGVPLADRDEITRARIKSQTMAEPSPFDDIGINPAAALAAWDDALAAPPWTEPPQWLHADLHPANLLTHGDKLSGVIDFGDLTSGDPATDLSVAWMLLPAAAHDAFFDAAENQHRRVDHSMRRRARGNALAHAMACLDHSADNPTINAIGRSTLAAVVDR